jgi:Endosomal/lysosomal potassium channel TMEM175
MLRGARRRGNPAGRGSAARPAEGTDLERGASLSKPIKAAGFIPTSRLEALTDAVFAFAMTLLVINIELPEGFHPKTKTDVPAPGIADLADTA